MRKRSGKPGWHTTADKRRQKRDKADTASRQGADLEAYRKNFDRIFRKDAATQCRGYNKTEA